MTKQTNPESLNEDAVVATYEFHAGAEAAIKALHAAGLDVSRLSIIGKDFETTEHALGFYTDGDRMKFWGGRGAVWGSLVGMLFGSAFFLLPAIGPIVVMGPLVGWLVGALEGAAVGGATGVVAAALSNLGMPPDNVVRYELDVKAGKFLVIAHGTPEMIVHARAVLGTTAATSVSSHATVPLAERVHLTATRYATLLTRAHVLAALTDDEIARVSTAEGATRLSASEEFLDLERLDMGVQRARESSVPMGRVLPRNAVQAATWTKIVGQLAHPPA